jgi:hypothetical protein
MNSKRWIDFSKLEIILKQNQQDINQSQIFKLFLDKHKQIQDPQFKIKEMTFLKLQDKDQ